MEKSITMKFAVYFVIQSWLFSEVLLSPLNMSQQSDSQHLRAADKATDKLPKELLNKTTSMIEEYDTTDRINIRDIFFRLRLRRSQTCYDGGEIKYNSCLGRKQFEVRCKSSHAGCLSYNVPPKCKTNYEMKFASNGAACSVATSCSCA